MASLKTELTKVRARLSEMWKANCAQVVAFDEMISAKDDAIEQLSIRVTELEARVSIYPGEVGALGPELDSGRATLPTHPAKVSPNIPAVSTPLCRGKAPPVQEFTGEDLESQLDDWLPSLERATEWNRWSPEEKLIQLAGHLRGRALQEYDLLRPGEKDSFESAVEALCSRLDPSTKAVAAQDFRHAAQRDTESVQDFIRRVERTFRTAYGRDPMSSETRDTLLLCQLQEGLRYELMKAPAVSGATKYQELCTAARNEEKHLAELKKRQEYNKPKPTRPHQTQAEDARPGSNTSTRSPVNPGGAETKKCYLCKKPGHLMRDCRMRKPDGVTRPAHTNQVKSRGPPDRRSQQPNPYELLYSSGSEEEEDVRSVRVSDGGSQSQRARVLVHSVPANGVIDTRSDITIMGRFDKCASGLPAAHAAGDSGLEP